MFKITKIRRVVLFLVIGLFLLQFFRIQVLVGGLTGSVAVLYLKLIDVFAYMESLAASMDFSKKAIIALVPVLVLYVVFGRAFCGWVCPMDFLFSLVNRKKDWTKDIVRVSGRTGYIIAGGFLLLAALTGIPLFSNYLSHLTNFFRALSASVFMALDFPVDLSVIYFSLSVIILLLVLERIYPRLWCRALCPAGKTYGLFNKISLLKLELAEGECGECNLCEQVCYMNVRITPYLDENILRDTDCIYCGRCVEGCGTKGKIVKLTFGNPKKHDNP